MPERGVPWSISSELSHSQGWLGEGAGGIAQVRQPGPERGRVARDLHLFFAPRQSQACRLLVECIPDTALQQQGAGDVFRLHARITGHGFAADVQRHPPRQASMAAAGALEGFKEL